jgi:NAD(P)-dependent dehydrogenase (short-subunit alcohol dehydrogenase family)
MDLKSIKTFADDILSTEKRIDGLILNAGIMALAQLEYTESGFEKQIGVNHFGHFYLLKLLEQKILAQKVLFIYVYISMHCL